MRSNATIEITHVVHSLETGGLENGVVNLVNRLDPARFRQTICCLTHAGTLERRIANQKAEIVELGLDAQGFRLPIFKLARFFRQSSPDIVHTRGWATVDAVFAARLAGVPGLVHGEHGRDWKDTLGTNWKRIQIRRLVGSLVSRYVVVCDFFGKWLQETCRVGRDKIVHIPNGVDTQKFQPLEDAQSAKRIAHGAQPSALGTQPSAFSTPRAALCALRQALGLPVEDVLIGSVGRLDPVKDFPTLLRAYAAIHSRYSDARLVIVGAGPCLNELVGLADSLGVSSHVHWLGERNDIPELLRCFDFFAQTSLFEGMSNTILEAMASGLAIVATSVGGNGELVEPGQNGALCPVGNAKALADVLAHYVENEELRKLHGSRSRSLAMEHFDLSAMVSRYAALYEEGRDSLQPAIKSPRNRSDWGSSFKTITLRYLPDKSLQALKKIHYARVLQSTTEHDVSDFKVVKHLVQSGDCVLDVGANVGIYTKFLSGLVGNRGRVVSIEPIPLTYEILRSNIRGLVLSNVEAVNCAVSDNEGSVVMEVPLYENGGENFYEARIIKEGTANGLRRVTVPARTIDSLFEGEESAVSFIKIDVEGNEFRCLTGALRLIRRAKPTMLIEVSGDPAEAGSQACATFKMLQNEGYEAWWFDGNRLHRWRPGDRSVNYFFLTSDGSPELIERGLLKAD